MSTTPVADFLNTFITPEAVEAAADRPWGDRSPDDYPLARFVHRQSIDAAMLYGLLVRHGVAATPTKARAAVKAEREAGALIRVGGGADSSYRTKDQQDALDAAAREADRRLRDLARRAEALGLKVILKTGRYGYVSSLDQASDDQCIRGIELATPVEDVVAMLEANR